MTACSKLSAFSCLPGQTDECLFSAQVREPCLWVQSASLASVLPSDEVNHFILRIRTLSCLCLFLELKYFRPMLFFYLLIVFCFLMFMVHRDVWLIFDHGCIILVISFYIYSVTASALEQRNLQSMNLQHSFYWKYSNFL